MGACPEAESPAFADAIMDVFGRKEYVVRCEAYRREQLLDWAGMPDPDLVESLALWVHEHRARGQTVLVHCEAGHNRSGLVTALYLIRYRGWAPHAAIDLIREKRGPNALWNGSFVRYLQQARPTDKAAGLW